MKFLFSPHGTATSFRIGMLLRKNRHTHWHFQCIVVKDLVLQFRFQLVESRFLVHHPSTKTCSSTVHEAKACSDVKEHKTQLQLKRSFGITVRVRANMHAEIVEKERDSVCECMCVCVCVCVCVYERDKRESMRVL